MADHAQSALEIRVNWRPFTRFMRRLSHWSRRAGIESAVRRRVIALESAGRLFRAWSARECGGILLLTPRVCSELQDLLADLRFATTVE